MLGRVRSRHMRCRSMSVPASAREVLRPAFRSARQIPRSRCLCRYVQRPATLRGLWCPLRDRRDLRFGCLQLRPSCIRRSRCPRASRGSRSDPGATIPRVTTSRTRCGPLLPSPEPLSCPGSLLPEPHQRVGPTGPCPLCSKPVVLVERPEDGPATRGRGAGMPGCRGIESHGLVRGIAGPGHTPRATGTVTVRRWPQRCPGGLYSGPGGRPLTRRCSQLFHSGVHR
jgi:hypothetical protein